MHEQQHFLSSLMSYVLCLMSYVLCIDRRCSDRMVVGFTTT
jgi:hypothetical protein